MAGRPRKTALELLIAGTWRKDRHGGRSLSPSDPLGPPPGHLGAEARRCWSELSACAPWLRLPDRAQAEVFVQLQAEARTDFAAMSATRLSLLSRQASKLGLGPVDRTRLAPQIESSASIHSTSLPIRGRNFSERLSRNEATPTARNRHRERGPRNSAPRTAKSFGRMQTRRLFTRRPFLLAKMHANSWQIGFQGFHAATQQPEPTRHEPTRSGARAWPQTSRWRANARLSSSVSSRSVFARR